MEQLTKSNLLQPNGIAKSAKIANKGYYGNNVEAWLPFKLYYGRREEFIL